MQYPEFRSNQHLVFPCAVFETISHGLLCRSFEMLARYLPTSPHGLKAQKTNIVFFAAMKTSDLIIFELVCVPPFGSTVERSEVASCFGTHCCYNAVFRTRHCNKSNQEHRWKTLLKQLSSVLDRRGVVSNYSNSDL